MNLGQIIADNILEGRSLLDLAQRDGGEETWEKVLAYPDFWEIRHDSMSSVRHMDNEELRQAIVADLVFVRIETIRGALGAYPLSQLFRHLGDAKRRSSNRITEALNEVMKTGLVVLQDGRLTIPEQRFEEAQGFCGCYLIDPVGEPDIIDDIMNVGGKELLADTFDDLSSSVAGIKP